MKTKIKIGRNKYKIQRVLDIPSKKGEETVGMIIPSKKTILIKKKGKRIDNYTLFHEIAHGVAFEMMDAAYRGYKKSKTRKYQNQFLRHHNALYRLNNDENFIEFLGKLLNDTFKLK